MRKITDCDKPEIPADGAIVMSLEKLEANGIHCHFDGERVLFWSDKFRANKKFDQAGIDLVNAANYDGVESHMMFNAINEMELNIRLIQVLQGKGVK